jgi:hypothetical protein
MVRPVLQPTVHPTVASEINFRPNTLFKKSVPFLRPWPLLIALPNSVKRIQGSESEVPASLYVHAYKYCNLLLCGMVLSRWPFLKDFA